MGSFSLDQENKSVILGYDDKDGSLLSNVSSVVSLDDEPDGAFEECDSSFPNHGHALGLGDMSVLLRQLPSKRSGLSKFFQGKSQSFTSLSKVTCLEDLAKPENPNNKKLKVCKSYVGFSRASPSRARNASSASLSK